jgi:Spy/CpxP family protein refolding chaperone
MMELFLSGHCLTIMKSKSLPLAGKEVNEMIRRCLIVVLLVGVVLAGFSSGALAFGSRAFSAEKMIDRIASDLGLTKQQKDKLLSGAKQVEEEAKDLHSKNREIYGKIEKELIKDAPDRGVLSDFLQQISQNNAQIHLKRMEQIIELRKELTPEQRTKFEKLMGERKEMANKRFSKRSWSGFRHKGF